MDNRLLNSTMTQRSQAMQDVGRCLSLFCGITGGSTCCDCGWVLQGLQPLPLNKGTVPQTYWRTTSTSGIWKSMGCHQCQFIHKLPESHGYNAVMVVVNLTGKCGHFIPTHTTVTALGSVWLYLQQVWKLHGLPLSVLSDHIPQFVS